MKIRMAIFGVLISLFCTFGVYAEEIIVETTVETMAEDVENTKTDATFDLTTLVAKLPCLNQAILYSWDDNKVKYAMSFTVISLFDDHINIDTMYVPATELGGLMSVKLFNLGNWIKFPLLKYIEFEPFIYYGIKDIGSGNNIGESDYGAGVKLLNIKF